MYVYCIDLLWQLHHLCTSLGHLCGCQALDHQPGEGGREGGREEEREGGREGGHSDWQVNRDR